MAWELHAYAIDRDGGISVKHIFYGHSQEEADRNFNAHVHGCPMFGPATHEGRVISIWHEVRHLPTEEDAQREADEADV